MENLLLAEGTPIRPYKGILPAKRTKFLRVILRVIKGATMDRLIHHWQEARNIATLPVINTKINE